MENWKDNKPKKLFKSLWSSIGYGLRRSKQYDNGDYIWLGFIYKKGEWYIKYYKNSSDTSNAIYY